LGISSDVSRRIEDYSMGTNYYKPEDVDVTNCDREQIHIPGSVQSFGALIAFDTDQTITRVSANISGWLPGQAENIIGRKLTEFFDEQDMAKILKSECKGWHSSQLSVLNSEKKFNAICRSNSNETYLDLLQESDPERRARYARSVTELTKNLSSATTENAVAQIMADLVHELSGFDRVKVYKFDEDWHGEVIAEAKVPEVPSYLGLHFPQSDIPTQARELYIRNKVRVIGDVNDPQIPLLERSDLKPLDMSFSFVRSVSPIHIQYLKNMMVSSSMSLSLFQNKRFWGLIACHHTTPRTFTFEEADFYDSISHLGSNRLSDLERISVAVRRAEYHELIQKMLADLKKSKKIQSMVEGEITLKDLISSTGAVVILSGQRVAKQGAVPDQDALDMLVSWLERGEDDVVSFDDLPQRYGQDIGSYACGMLAARLPDSPRSWLIWFRFEVAEEVKWAGDPFKPAEETMFGKRLYPRTSFELWKEIKKGSFLPVGGTRARCSRRTSQKPEQLLAG